MAATSVQVLPWLQRALAHEWAAAGQFLAQSAIAQAQGLEAFAAFSQASALEELGHASLLAGHLALLGRKPQPNLAPGLDPGQDAASMLAAAMDTERRAVALYSQAAQCVRALPFWAALFSSLAQEEERHRLELDGWHEKLRVPRHA